VPVIRSPSSNPSVTTPVALSSIVIFISLALAFSTWARTVLALILRLPYAYFADWIGPHNVKRNHFYSTSALKERERTKIQDLHRRTVARRVAEINNASQGPSVDDQDLKSSWGGSNGRAVNRGIGGFWHRKPRRDAESG
jgi:hypothetical protein